MEQIIGIATFSFEMLLKLAVLFLAISAMVAMLLKYLPVERLKKQIGSEGLPANFMGSLMGAVTPFCACSTIPMTLGLIKSGFPFGATMSFLIASPIMNPIVLTMVFTLMGVKAGLIYFLATFGGAVIFGYVLSRTGGERNLKIIPLNNQTQCTPCGCAATSPPTFAENLRTSVAAAWKDFRGMFGYLLFGVVAGSLIYGFVPHEMILGVAGPGKLLAIPMAAVIGIPLFLRAESAIALGLVLMESGMGVGAVIALIIGASGMAIPEVSLLAGIFRKRLVASVVAVVFMTAVAGGAMFQLLF
jgi:uncharacterized protein